MIIAKPGRSNVGVSFSPIPKGPVTIPSPIYVRGDVVGELIAFDSATGTGTAAINNDVNGAQLVQMSLLGYGYLGISLTPDEKGVFKAPDYRKVEALINTFKDKDNESEEALSALVTHVLEGMGNPPKGGQRDEIIAHVRQWHVMQHSP